MSLSDWFDINENSKITNKKLPEYGTLFYESLFHLEKKIKKKSNPKKNTKSKKNDDEFNIKEFVIQNCKLKKELCYFPIGTKFTQIILNDCNVFQLNIHSNKINLFQPNGYNYTGKYNVIIDGKKYLDTIGYHGFAYIGKHGKLSITQDGFSCNEMICSEETHLYKKDTIIKSVSIDYVHGVLTGFIDKEFIHHKLELDLYLRKEYVPVNYAQKYLAQKYLDQGDYDYVIERKLYIDNPPEIQKNIEK